MTLLIPFLLLLSGLPPDGGTQPSGQPPGRSRHIDGSKTPEQIPDDTAYDSLLRQLTGPGSASSRERFVSVSGLNEADARLVILCAERYEEALAEAYRTGREARMGATRPPAPVQRQAAMQSQLRARQLLQEIQRSFKLDLTPEGSANLQTYVLNHIKRNMSMVIDNPVVSVRPADPARRPDVRSMMMSNALGGANSEAERNALIEAAHTVLPVRHVSETEMETVIELWNASTRSVLAFSVALCAPSLGMGSGQGFLANLHAVAEPGATVKVGVSKRNRPQCDPLTPKATSVIFDDGTSAGLPLQVQRFKRGLLGQISETERIARIVESAGDAPDWAALRQQIGEAPSGDKETLREAFGNVLSSDDLTGLASTADQVPHEVLGAMMHVRVQAIHRIEQMAASDPGQWKRFREEFRERAGICQDYRHRAGKNLYP